MASESDHVPNERAARVRRKRGRRRPRPATAAREPLDAQGRERPAFLLNFPSTPELDRLIDAFEAGNFARVRAEAPRLAESTHDPDVRHAALELYRRIQPDPLIKYLLAVSIVLLVFLVSYVYGTHDHP
jgi:hypothetical protein